MYINIVVIITLYFGQCEQDICIMWTWYFG